jgi:hypothetical protein
MISHGLEQRWQEGAERYCEFMKTINNSHTLGMWFITDPGNALQSLYYLNNTRASLEILFLGEKPAAMIYGQSEEIPSDLRRHFKQYGFSVNGSIVYNRSRVQEVLEENGDLFAADTSVEEALADPDVQLDIDVRKVGALMGYPRKATDSSLGTYTPMNRIRKRAYAEMKSNNALERELEDIRMALEECEMHTAIWHLILQHREHFKCAAEDVDSMQWFIDSTKKRTRVETVNSYFWMDQLPMNLESLQLRSHLDRAIVNSNIIRGRFIR